MGGRFPFPDYPTGWYRVAISDDFGADVLHPISFFGLDLVAFRLGDDSVHVMEAHCPHLGAHLGVGGCIDEGRIVCPFHGWKFDVAGRNVDIPYRDHVNRNATLRTLPARDWCGLTMVWFDAAAGPPSWELPAVAEFHDDAFLWHAPAEARWRVRTHPQEIFENTVDVAHFQFVHGVSWFGAPNMAEAGPSLHASAELNLTTPHGPATGAVVNELWGLGVDINRVVGIGDAATIVTATPIDGECVEVAFAFLSPRSANGKGIGRFGDGHVRDTICQLKADIPIWENKRYRAKPNLTSGEGAILSFRRWARQFYPVTT